MDRLGAQRLKCRDSVLLLVVVVLTPGDGVALGCEVWLLPPFECSAAQGGFPKKPKDLLFLFVL